MVDISIQPIIAREMMPKAIAEFSLSDVWLKTIESDQLV